MEDLIAFGLPLVGAGLVAGFMAGLLGIGGGMVTIPPLFLAFSKLGVPMEWRMHVSIATALTIIIATNLSSVWAHNRKGGVDWGIVKDWWWAVALGAIGGTVFAKELKTAELVYFFASMAALLAIKMLVPMERFKLGPALPTSYFRFLNPGLIGFFSAVMGIGGGSFSVPYMTLYSVPIHRAVGTAALIGLTISVSGGLGYLFGGWGLQGMPAGMAGFIHMPSVAIVALASVMMAPVGAKVAHRLPKAALSIIFGLFLVVASIRLVSAV